MTRLDVKFAKWQGCCATGETPTFLLLPMIIAGKRQVRHTSSRVGGYLPIRFGWSFLTVTTT